MIDFGLLHPDIADMRWLRPTAPAVALPRLLRTIEQDIARQRRREAELARTFEPLIARAANHASSPSTSMVNVLEGLTRITSAINQALDLSCQEMLTIQPGGARPPGLLAEVRPRVQDLLDRGARQRTLYQHTARHAPATLAHYEQLHGDVEVRTLDEVTERLIIFDRTVAFIPASEDRSVALELRQPALVTHLVTLFERLWRLGTPMHPLAAKLPSTNGITTRQRAIAELLIEGHADKAIADRLGMNIRTVRAHIAKLSSILGSSSRTQLGYLIARSELLDQTQ
ncbi:helix-turn-helix transcriptional regulator [Streptomyces sp. E11-3]|uniref:helix-turn-helix transcriptional regulator n=1 Tax=Streptomyces sp. E11-3 TaxID=3110112 RepID=UPI00397EF9C1